MSELNSNSLLSAGLNTLYNTSIEIKELFDKEYTQQEKPNIEFINGDFLKQDLSKASVIFINSTTFSDKLLEDLALKFNEECESGCIVVNTTMELSKLISEAINKLDNRIKSIQKELQLNDL